MVNIRCFRRPRMPRCQLMDASDRFKFGVGRRRPIGRRSVSFFVSFCNHSGVASRRACLLRTFVADGAGTKVAEGSHARSLFRRTRFYDRTVLSCVIDRRGHAFFLRCMDHVRRTLGTRVVEGDERTIGGLFASDVSGRLASNPDKRRGADERRGERPSTTECSCHSSPSDTAVQTPSTHSAFRV